MKLTALRVLVVALSCICTVVVLTNLRAPKAAANGKDFAPLYAALGMPQPAQTPALQWWLRESQLQQLE